VSALVSSHNEAALLARCLDAIRGCDEVIVIDIDSHFEPDENWLEEFPALDAKLPERFVQQVGLPRGRPDPIPRTFAVTKARPVEKMMTRCAGTRRSATPLVFQSAPVTALPWISTTGRPWPRSL